MLLTGVIVILFSIVRPWRKSNTIQYFLKMEMTMGKVQVVLQLLVMPLRRYRDNEAKLSGGLKVLKRIEQ